MNTAYAPNGSFSLNDTGISNRSDNSTVTVGYDAVVCVEVYEPWVVEAYNASGITPSLTRVVGRGNDIPDENHSPSAGTRRRELLASGLNVSRAINSTGKFTPFDGVSSLMTMLDCSLTRVFQSPMITPLVRWRRTTGGVFGISQHPW